MAMRMRPEMKVIVIINFSEKSLQRKCKYKFYEKVKITVTNIVCQKRRVKVDHKDMTINPSISQSEFIYINKYMQPVIIDS